MGEPVRQGEALQRDRASEPVDEDERARALERRVATGEVGVHRRIGPGRRHQRAGAVGQLGGEAGVDDVDARLLDQRHRSGSGPVSPTPSS